VQIDTVLNDNFKLKKDDIVFVRSNGNKDLIGRCVLIPELHFPATFSGFTIRLRFNANEFDSKFYAYLFKSDQLRKKLIDSGTGANIKSLNQTALNNLEIPFPSFSIQKQIVSRIEQEQELVNASKELIEIFEQKIKDRIAKVWGEKKKEYKMEDEALSMVAEDEDRFLM
jgi:restriction endonuclease S subunit